MTDLIHIATFRRPTVRKLRNPKSYLDSVSSQVEHWNKLETLENTGSGKCFLTFKIKIYIFLCIINNKIKIYLHKYLLFMVNGNCVEPLSTAASANLVRKK